MSMIYQPNGKAREYSPLALNIYLQCTHGCKYCYAPRARHQRDEDYFASQPMPRPGIVEKLAAELRKNEYHEQVLFSFIGDPYCDAADKNDAARQCLELLLMHQVPVAILTKGGERCLADEELFARFGDHIMVGTTLTFDNDRDSTEWESGAARPEERLEVLRHLHNRGIRTFASFEPVIVPSQSLALMRKGLDAIDVYKVGKLNNYRGIDKTIDWKAFLVAALDILRGAGKETYIKYDLRQAAKDVMLTEDETIADRHCVTW